MKKLYTQRNAPPKMGMIYIFERSVRNRMLITLEGHILNGDQFYRGLQRDLGKVYGGLQSATYVAARVSDNPAIEHLYYCEDEEVIDYFEAAFHQDSYCGKQEGVDDINAILEMEGIGYRFSNYPKKSQKRKGIPEVHFPEGLRVTDGFAYSNIVKPVLEFLVEDGFDLAHHEFMRSLATFRQGELDSALTFAGSSFESFLKTLMTKKSWEYNETDGCSVLVKKCIEHKLIPPFYEGCLVGLGTIRNKLSSAHGRGPKVQYPPSPEAVEHLIHLVCSNILFLRECAAK